MLCGLCGLGSAVVTLGPARRATREITWRKRVMRRIWYPREYQILRAGQILRANPYSPTVPGLGEVSETHEALNLVATCQRESLSTGKSG